MSIGPVQIALPASPPPTPARQAADIPSAPAALLQTGASVSAPAKRIPDNGIVRASSESRAIGADAEVPSTDQDTDLNELAAAIEHAQKAVNTQVRDFSFSIHEKTGEVVVRIIDRESKEVIRQIPAEEMLRIAEHLQTLDGKHKPGLLLKQEV